MFELTGEGEDDPERTAVSTDPGPVPGHTRSCPRRGSPNHLTRYPANDAWVHDEDE